MTDKISVPPSLRSGAEKQVRFGGRRSEEFAVSVVGCPTGDYQRAFEGRGLKRGERSGLETATWSRQCTDHL